MATAGFPRDDWLERAAWECSSSFRNLQRKPAATRDFAPSAFFRVPGDIERLRLCEKLAHRPRRLLVPAERRRDHAHSRPLGRPSASIERRAA